MLLIQNVFYLISRRAAVWVLLLDLGEAYAQHWTALGWLEDDDVKSKNHAVDYFAHTVKKSWNILE